MDNQKFRLYSKKNIDDNESHQTKCLVKPKKCKYGIYVFLWRKT